MLGKLLAAFILIPLIEFFLLVKVANETSVGMTFLIVILTGIMGSFLARREGLGVLRRFHLAMGEGRVPSNELQEGLMIVFAGALLLTPGLLTDAFGFFLLLPFGRRLVRLWFVNRYAGRFQVHMSDLDGFHNTARSTPFQESTRDFNSQDAIDIEVVRRKQD
jgi:UPF0716 protein FxsA